MVGIFTLGWAGERKMRRWEHPQRKRRTFDIGVWGSAPFYQPSG